MPDSDRMWDSRTVRVWCAALRCAAHDKTIIAQLGLMNASQLGTMLVSVSSINSAVATYDSKHTS